MGKLFVFSGALVISQSKRQTIFGPNENTSCREHSVQETSVQIPRKTLLAYICWRAPQMTTKGLHASATDTLVENVSKSFRD